MYSVYIKRSTKKRKKFLFICTLGKKLWVTILMSAFVALFGFFALDCWAAHLAMKCNPTSFVEVGSCYDGYTIESILSDTTALVSSNTNDLYVVTLTGEVWLSRPVYYRLLNSPKVAIKSIEPYENDY